MRIIAKLVVILVVGVQAFAATLLPRISESVTVKVESEVGKFYKISQGQDIGPDLWVTNEIVIGDGKVIERWFDQVNHSFFKVEEEAKPDLSGRVLYRLEFPANVNMALMKFVKSEIVFCSFPTNNFSNSDFTDAIIEATFNGCNMPDCKFDNTWMLAPIFSDSKMQRSTFKNAALYSATFTNADLTDANFDEATIVYGDFRGSIGADLSKAHVMLTLMPDGTLRSDEGF